MKKSLIVLLILIGTHAQAQQFYTDLFGFRLGQYRKVIKTQLGAPIKTGKYEDGFEFEAYALRPDKSLLIIFEYAAKQKDMIWSIQVSGSNTTTDLGFKNLKLGIDKAQTQGLIGKPTSTKDIGEYGTMWEYDKANFSVEISKSGKLSSVKILDNSNDLFPKGPDITKVPPFDKIRTALTSGSNSEIANMLSGDIEVYYNNQTYTFKKSVSDEESTGFSKLFSVIKTISKDLGTVNTKDDKTYEESMRVALGEDTKHVIKIKRHIIKEIVLKYFGGKYYIYEINADTK